MGYRVLGSTTSVEPSVRRVVRGIPLYRSLKSAIAITTELLLE
jgi:hypothetical protein